jgi:hypothetical protein
VTITGLDSQNELSLLREKALDPPVDSFKTMFPEFLKRDDGVIVMISLRMVPEFRSHSSGRLTNQTVVTVP